MSQQPRIAKPTGLRRWLPVLQWLPHYDRSWLRGDFIAGLTVMALLVPEGMAYAELAGVPPQAAFYAAPAGLILYAIFGTSRQLVVAVSSVIAVMSASIVGALAPADTPEYIALTAALAMLTGVVALLAGLLRLGRIAQFFSESVLVGFVSGLALVIMIKQIPKLFGLEAGHGNFWERVYDLIIHLPETHLLTLVVGITTLVVMVVMERRFHKIPAAMVAMIYGIVVTSLFNLAAYGVHIIGEIPAGLARPQLPGVGIDALIALLPGAIGLTLVMFAEAIGPAHTFAGKHRYQIDANQELIGMGVANLGAGWFQGFSIGASLSKSAANDANGARSQMSGIIAAVLTGLVALFLTPLFYNLPEAALAAIVVVAVYGMFKWPAMRRLYAVRRLDFALALVALLGVLTFEEAVYGLLVAVIASLASLVWRASQSRLSVLGRAPGGVTFDSMETRPDHRPIPGLLILRPDEGLYFANASSLRQKVQELALAAEPLPRTVLIDLEMTYDLDVPSAHELAELHTDLTAWGTQLALARVHGPVQAVLDRAGVTTKIGAEHIYVRVLEGAIFHLSADSATQETLLGLSADALRRLQLVVTEMLPQAEGAQRARLEALITRLRRALDQAEPRQPELRQPVSKEGA